MINIFIEYIILSLQTGRISKNVARKKIDKVIKECKSRGIIDNLSPHIKEVENEINKCSE